MAAHMPEEQQFLLTRQRFRDGELPFLYSEFEGDGWLKVRDGETYLHMACYYRQSAIIDYLIMKAKEHTDRAEIDTWLKNVGPCENSPLHNYLCQSATAYLTKQRDQNRKPCRDVIIALTELGIDINSQNSYKETALFLAINRDDILSVQTLIGIGANVNIKCCVLEETALHRACLQNLELLKLLIKVPSIKINTADNRGVTALHLACHTNKPQQVALLLRHGADITALTLRGETPIFYSIRPSMVPECSVSSLVQSSETSFEVMFRHIQNPKNKLDSSKCFLHKNKKNESLLLVGVRYGNLAAVKLLVEQLSLFDVNNRTEDGKTLIHHAMLQCQDTAMMDYLLEQGVLPDIQDDKGNTALMYLFKKGPATHWRADEVATPNMNV